MEDSWYDTAQICTNGHVITSEAISSPTLTKSFCDKCGAPTITNCRNCHAAIKGYYHVPWVVGAFGYQRPNLCHECGEPYPWTEAKLKVAQRVTDLLEDLSPEERSTLKRSLDDIVRDTPRTAPAATTVKKLVAKVARPAADALKGVLVDVLSEPARKIIWP
jgi:hypothetical protein